MNRRLRRMHGVAACVVAVAAPVTLAVAIAGRRPIPTIAVPSLRGDSVSAIEATGGQPGHWRGIEATSRVGADARGRPVVEVTPLHPSGAPDVLVYWAPVEPAERLPEGAILLGALDGTGPRAFGLPAAAREAPGYLVAFSLAHGDVIGTCAIAPPVLGGIDR